MRKTSLMKSIVAGIVAVSSVVVLSACGSTENTVDTGSTENEAVIETGEGPYFSKDATVEEVLTKAAEEEKIGNWGLGDQYGPLALMEKYNLESSFLSQGFAMDQFDDDTLMVASAMTYNEIGLVVNDYDGAYGYGEDKIGIIDLNKEGVAVLEDNLVCTKEFAETNPNTVKAFISAAMKGWAYAVENPEEAAQIVYNNGSSVSPEHQSFMANEVAKLVSTNTRGEKVTEYGILDQESINQSLDFVQKYVKLDDNDAAERLAGLTAADICDDSYWVDAMAGNFGTPEKADVSIQLKWLPQSQFMGYYVAKDMGYFDEVGLNVNIISGGGDIPELTAVNNGSVDFASSWFAATVTAKAGGMELIEIAQPYQSAGMTLIYKIN